MVLALVVPSVAQAFPDGASELSDIELMQRLSDRVFDVKLADGVSWRLEYKSNGYFFIDTSNNFRGDGKWAAENGKLCGQLRGRDRTCSDVRLHQDILHVKRISGEIMRLVPR